MCQPGYIKINNNQKQNLKEPKEPEHNRCNTDTCNAVIAYRVAAAARRA